MKKTSSGSRKKLPPIWAEKVDRLEEVVAHEFGFETTNEIWKRVRTPYSCWARWITWHRMLKWGMTSVMAGQYSGFHHSSVLYGVTSLIRDSIQVDDLQQIITRINTKSSEQPPIE
jgi:hypothetical protein